MKKIFLIALTTFFAFQAYCQLDIKVTTEIKYDSLYALDDDYYAVRLNNLWGVVRENTIVLPIRYDAIESFGDGMIGFVKNSLVGFADLQGREVVEAKYRTDLDFSRKEQTTLNIFDSGSALVYDGARLRVINSEGKQVLDDSYEIISKHGNTIVYKNGVAYGMADAKGTITAEAKYMQIETIIAGKLYAYLGIRDGLKVYGIIGADGQQKSLPYYDDVQLISKNDELFIKAFLPTGKQSLYDAEGELLFQPLYQTIEPSNLPFFYNITDNTKRGIVGKDMVLYVPAAYEDVQVVALDNDTFFVAKNDGVSFILNRKNQLLAHYEGGIAGFVSYNQNNVIFVADSFLNYGVYSSQDGWLVKPQYDEALGKVSNNIIFKKGKKWGAVSLSGEVVVPFEYEKVKLSPKRNYVVFYEGKNNSVILDENAKQQSFEKVKTLQTLENYVKYDVKGIENRLYLNGEKVVSPYKSMGSTLDAILPVQDAKGWTYADSKTLKPLTDKHFDYCTYFKNSQALAVEGDELIIIDKNFNKVSTVLRGEKSKLNNIAATLIFADKLKKNHIIIKMNGKYGVVKAQ